MGLRVLALILALSSQVPDRATGTWHESFDLKRSASPKHRSSATALPLPSLEAAVARSPRGPEVHAAEGDCLTKCLDEERDPDGSVNSPGGWERRVHEFASFVARSFYMWSLGVPNALTTLKRSTSCP